MKKRFSVTIDEKLVEKIDKERGLVPRSAYIEKMLRDVIESD